MIHKNRRVSTNPLSYFTLPAIILTLLIAYVCYDKYEQLDRYFSSNVIINGLIVGIITYCIIRIYYNNYLFYRSALYAAKVDDMSNDKSISENSVKTLLNQLHGRGKLLDTINMERGIAHISHKGGLFLTDHDAMLIKSKLGSRSNFLTSKIQYLAGTLVILGLLGTFWGLLTTIAAVGQVLGGLDDAVSNPDAPENLAAILSGISGPLEGMEVAFSSSLFGLTGSLIVGLLNHFTSRAKNGFIDSIAGWLDSKIARLDVEDEDHAKKALESNDEFKTWIASYILNANRTNKNVNSLMRLVTALCETTEKNITTNNKISEEQQNLNAILQNIGDSSQTSKEVQIQLLQSSQQLNSTVSNALVKFVEEANVNKTQSQQNGESISNLKRSIQTFFNLDSTRSINKLIDRQEDELRQQQNEDNINVNRNFKNKDLG